MPRSLRIERENGIYHVINRGNYRQDLFINEGAHQSFEKCLFETCEKSGWVLEGFCVLTNHFHLVVRTPRGNLAKGMKWLQSTFANRYHRFRTVNGKLFQGRYKSLIVQEDAYLGALQHYVHLNPVRAGICPVEALKSYRWSSYWYLHHSRQRPSALDISGALDHAGELRDSPSGRQKYHDYLCWLVAEDRVQKEMAFDKMSRGWALGSKAFKRALLQTEGLLKNGDFTALRLEGKELQEANDLICAELLKHALAAAEKNRKAILQEKKSAPWKIWIARELKSRTCASNGWIAHELNMGAAQAVSLHVGRFNLVSARKLPQYNRFIQKFTE